MKKNVKKLHLHRETLHSLSGRPLQEVAGGVTLTKMRTCEGWTQEYATCDCSFPTSFACCG
jgi:hypothetical protein